MLDKILQIKDAVALLRAQVAAREQPAELCPAGAVLRIGEDVGRAIAEGESRARVIAQRKLGLALGEMRAHDSRNAVAVGEPEAEIFEPCGRGDQLLGMRGAPQEREIRRDGELDVVRHGELATRRGRLLRTPLPLWERVVPSEARDRVRGQLLRTR